MISLEFTDDYDVPLDHHIKLCIFNYKFFRHVYNSTAFSLLMVTTSFKSFIRLGWQKVTVYTSGGSRLAQLFEV